MAASKDNSAGDPPEAAGRHERFHKAYFGEAVAVRDALVGLVPLAVRCGPLGRLQHVGADADRDDRQGISEPLH